MRWTISSEGQVRNGLRTIGAIPNHKICLIEGPNGIGKTVAMQLFELISGSIPRGLANAAVWKSFKSNLGNTVVNIADMKGGQSAQVVFTPNGWPTEPPASVTNTFGTVTLDGKASSMQEIASLLEVTTIRGDESLQDTVRAHIEKVESHLHQTTTTVNARANETDEFLAQFSSDWVRADPHVLVTHAAEVDALTTELVSAQDHLHASEQVSSELGRALELVRKLASADTDVQALLVRQGELRTEVSKLKTKIADLEAESEAAEATLTAQGGAAADLSQAERALRTRETRRANQFRDLAVFAADNDLAPELRPVSDALKLARTNYDDLAAQVDTIDRGRRVQDVLGRLMPVLEANSESVSNDVLMIIEDKRYSGTQVQGGLLARSKEIAENPQPDAVLATVAHLDEAKRRVASLTAYEDALRQLARTETLIDEATRDLTAAQSKAAGASEAATVLRAVHEALGAAQADLTKAHQSSVDLQERIGLSGVTSAKEAKAALTSMLAKLGLEEAQLDSAEAVAAANLRAASGRVAECREAIAVAQRSADEVVGGIKALTNVVSTSASYEWLRVALGGRQLDDLSGSGLETFSAIRSAILGAGEAVFAAVGQLQGLVQLAHVLAEAKPTKSDSAQLAKPLAPSMERALGESLRRALNTDSIRTRVFGGMEVFRLDLQDQVLVLRGADGVEEDRAMSAFSTGERAFAFTQARIKDLTVSDKPNRLLVLDEFGAFISADRMSDLKEFLETLDDLADQILIILPLQVNYQEELKDTRGELRVRYEERIRQLESEGYSAVPL